MAITRSKRDTQKVRVTKRVPTKDLKQVWKGTKMKAWALAFDARDFGRALDIYTASWYAKVALHRLIPIGQRALPPEIQLRILDHVRRDQGFNLAGDMWRNLTVNFESPCAHEREVVDCDRCRHYSGHGKYPDVNPRAIGLQTPPVNTGHRGGTGRFSSRGEVTQTICDRNPSRELTVSTLSRHSSC